MSRSVRRCSRAGLAVQVQKFQAAQLLLRQLGHMARGAEGVAAAHHHRVLLKQIHQPGKGKEAALLLVWLQPAVQLQNGLQWPDGQDMAAFGHIGLHAGEDLQTVFQLQDVPRSAAYPRAM